MLGQLIFELALVFLLNDIPVDGKDLLHLFRPKPDLPQELNDFLTDVQHHKQDFAFIRNIAKNRMKYEKSFVEHQNLFADDINNQMMPVQDSEGELLSKRSLYPNQRYSRFIHSPVRLKRDMKVQVKTNSDFGNIPHSERKFIGNNFEKAEFRNDDNENRYHTGYVVADEDDDDGEASDDEEDDEGYYDIQEKKKREVEISIKSDGKLVKHLEENENGPKSIVLSINANEAVSKTFSTSTYTPFSSMEPIRDNNNYLSNRKTIPSLANGNPIQNNVGIPIPVVSNVVRPAPVASREEHFNTNVPQIRDWVLEEDNHMMTHNNFDNIYNGQKDQFETIQPMIMDKPYLGNTKLKKRWMDSINNVDSAQFQDNHFPTQSAYWKTGNGEINLDPNRSYEVIEKSTRDTIVIPLVTTTGCVQEIYPTEVIHNKMDRHKEAEEIGKAIAQEIEREEEAAETATDCSTPLTEEFEIVRHHKPKHHKVENPDCDDDNVEEIEIIHAKPGGYRNQLVKRAVGKKTSKKKKKKIKKTSTLKDKKSKKKKKKRPGREDITELRNRKHLPSMPKYKRKRVRQHPKKRIDRDLEDYYLNELYDSPDHSLNYIPSFHGRKLQQAANAEYEFNPFLIKDFDNHEKEDIEKFERQQMIGARKKFKTEGDYAEEEDPMVESSTPSPPVIKSQTQLDSKSSTDENDDEYNYSDLTDMDDDEEEDIAYVEEGGDKLDVEEPVTSFNRNEHENDRIDEFESMSSYLRIVTMPDSAKMDIANVLLEADEALVGAHAHERGGAKKQKKKKKQKHTKRNLVGTLQERKIQLDRRMKNHKLYKLGKATVDKAVKVNSNGHIPGKENIHKGKQKKPKRESEERDPKSDQVNEQLQEKPLSNQEKQDLFLRYNPDFQRWPRFVQNDIRYHELMRRKALENEKNFSGAKKIPMSNVYIKSPNFDFVKRQEPSTEETVSSAISDESVTSTESVSPANELNESTESSMETSSESVASSDVGTPSVNEETFSTFSGASEFVDSNTSLSIDDTTVADEVGLVPNLSVSTVVTPTQFEFPVNAGDLTTNDHCNDTMKAEITPCPDEKGEHKQLTITSVLPLISDAVTHIQNMSKDEFLDLSEIVDGALPRYVVSQSLSNAKGSVRQGLRADKYNINLALSSYNSSAETNLILNQMSNLIMTLKYHTICQSLSPNLMHYIKIITRNEMDDPMTKLKEMNEIDFDEHQSNYMFHSFNSQNLNEKERVLKELLSKYNNLPANCKERAEPVREYILSHLAMVEKMNKRHPEESTTLKPKVKKDIKLENQLMEEGLNNQNPNANQVIDGGGKRNVREVNGDTSTSTSPQYRKLADAVRNVRSRRDIMRRIGEIYSEHAKEGEEEIGFEAPRVISLS